jgi:hypothetical protein
MGEKAAEDAITYVSPGPSYEPLKCLTNPDRAWYKESR